VKPARVTVLVLGLLGAGASSWALYHFGALREAVAWRLGAGLGVGLVLLVVLPALWPERSAGGWENEWRLSGEDEGYDPPAMLHALELAVTLAASGYDLHYRLRPVLAELAQHRLQTGHLADLSGSPSEETRALLGDRLWELVRPERPAPSDPTGPGIAPADLLAIVQRLESL
jgi:hypothetical protein